MDAIEYTRTSEYEIGPFGECSCTITFLYYPTSTGDDEAVEIQSASFYDLDLSRDRPFGREAASNIHRDIDEQLLEYAQAKYQSEQEGRAEDHAYQDYRERDAA